MTGRPQIKNEWKRAWDHMERARKSLWFQVTAWILAIGAGFFGITSNATGAYVSLGLIVGIWLSAALVFLARERLRWRPMLYPVLIGASIGAIAGGGSGWLHWFNHERLSKNHKTEVAAIKKQLDAANEAHISALAQRDAAHQAEIATAQARLGELQSANDLRTRREYLARIIPWLEKTTEGIGKQYIATDEWVKKVQREGRPISMRNAYQPDASLKLSDMIGLGAERATQLGMKTKVEVPHFTAPPETLRDKDATGTTFDPKRNDPYFHAFARYLDQCRIALGALQAYTSTLKGEQHELVGKVVQEDVRLSPEASR